MLSKMRKLQLFLFCFFFICLMVGSQVGMAASLERRTYIVHTKQDSMPMSFASPLQWYESMLSSVSQEPTESTVIYTYSTVLQGFSSPLTEAEAEYLRANPHVLSIVPEQVYKPATTRTPHFLGLDHAGDLLSRSDGGHNIIIGMLDSGIWPESKSFNDQGLGPIPSKWKGKCVEAKTFNASSCNRKLIGAQFFSASYERSYGPINETKESRSPRDDNGHGTHTSSTAAGSPVGGASMFGYAQGEAKGMATRARIAAYKVCWVEGCFSSDILAAMDKAILDGVDILSLSLGGDPEQFYLDSIAVGAFAAVRHGILVSCAAGNSGPSYATVSNVAPWIVTVGASSIDRDFPSYAMLANGARYVSQSLYHGKPLPPQPTLPLVYGQNASDSYIGIFCLNGTLNPSKVAGKIVFCRGFGSTSTLQTSAIVKAAGAAGVIIDGMEYGFQLRPRPYFLPTVLVSSNDGEAIVRYIQSSPRPNATIITGTTRVGVEPAPLIAPFSSRGPNSITPEILKPDVIAPGLNILAAWSGNSAPSTMAGDKRRVEFNIISGTSMSCPHVSGLAALLKAAHPDWSPAAIKSALMTTSYSAYQDGRPLIDSATLQTSSPLVHGAGHVAPEKALNPGLVYDITADEYLDFLCGIGYTEQQIAILAPGGFGCKNGGAGGLNYPSFVVQFPAWGSEQNASFTRTLTNVGDSGSRYSVSISVPQPVKAMVHPQVLSFSRKGEMMSYTVTFTSHGLVSLGMFMDGYLEWSDGQHHVRSPIVFTWK